VTFGLLFTGTGAAFADTGGGGTGGGGTPGGGSNRFDLFTFDNQQSALAGTPEQGTGQASIDYFNNLITGAGYRWASGQSLDVPCQAAIAQSLQRTPGATTARVVQVGFSYGGAKFAGYGGDQTAMRNWYEGLTSSNSWQPNLTGYTPEGITSVHDNFVANIIPNPRIVCVALNNLEPLAQNYTLNVTTDHSTPFATAGGSTPVSDAVNTDDGGSSFVENVDAVVTLHWAGVEGNPKQASKTVSVANNGTTSSPNFSPSDFGWTSWPEGKFWYDVDIAKQGHMSAAASHAGINDSRENWLSAPVLPLKLLTTGSPAG